MADPNTTQQGFSAQPTTLIETTLAETLGLSMHNAIANQQQSQMTMQASLTKACERLLQVRAAPVAPPPPPPPPEPEPEPEVEPESEPRETFDIGRLLDDD